MKQTLHNIISLEALRPDSLASVVIVPGKAAYTTFPTPVGVGLELASPASIRHSTKTVDRTKVHTVQLTATLAEHVDVDGYPVCYIATSADGSRWLIGNAFMPYPVSDIEDVMPSRFSEASVCNLTVQWTGTVGLLPLIDNGKILNIQ